MRQRSPDRRALSTAAPQDEPKTGARVVLRAGEVTVERTLPAPAFALLDDWLNLHVERIASGNSELGSHWRVADRILADELRIAARILHVDAYRPRRQRIPEALFA